MEGYGLQKRFTDAEQPLSQGSRFGNRSLGTGTVLAALDGKRPTSSYNFKQGAIQNEAPYVHASGCIRSGVEVVEACQIKKETHCSDQEPG